MADKITQDQIDELESATGTLGSAAEEAEGWASELKDAASDIQHHAEAGNYCYANDTAEQLNGQLDQLRGKFHELQEAVEEVERLVREYLPYDDIDDEEDEDQEEDEEEEEE